MNKFAEYTTQQAFVLSLSCPMIEVLMRCKDLSCIAGAIDGMGTARALERRGLIEWDWDEKTASPCNPHLTKAATLLIPLLEEAGFNGSPTDVNDSI